MRSSTIQQIVFPIILLIVFSCGNPSTRQQSFEVDFKGALKNIMHKGDLSAKVSLSKFSNIENLYALGAIENLKGEIQIIDSEPYNSYVEKGEIKFDSSYAQRATLLVYSIVEHWVTIPIPATVITLKDLENCIKEAAQNHNIDTNQAFPFSIEGRPKEISWHVINWKDGDTEHTHEKHISSGLSGTVRDEEVVLLGFYSNSHHAIFTHHTTNMHIHLKSNNGNIAGHVDDLTLHRPMILKLPKNE